jgi:hypothetical protein
MTASPLQLIALCALICCFSLSVSAGEHRSRAVAREFQREHPCPSTGLTSGACPGTEGITLYRLPVADRTRFQTCNGKRFAMREPRDRWERKA